MRERRYRIVYQSHEIRVMSTGDFGIEVTVADTRGTWRHYWYDPELREFEDWAGAPKYLSRHIDRRLRKDSELKILRFYERTADEGKRWADLRYFNHERWGQVLRGMCVSVAPDML